MKGCTLMTLVVLLGACGGDKDDPGDTDVAGDADTDADADADSDADADADSDTDADTDSDTDSDADTDPGTGATGDTGSTTIPWTLRTCPVSPPRDGVSIFDPASQVQIQGDRLVVDFGYSGGCAVHAVDLCFGDQFQGSSPALLSVTLTHDGMGDMCQAFIYDTLELDLLPVQSQYQASFGAATGSVDLVLMWPDAAGGQGSQTVTYRW